MKRTILLSLLTIIALCTYAQDIDQKNVPAVVLNAFQLKFANADDVDWELEKGNYHVEFEINNKNHDVLLDDRGNVLRHEQDLWESEIPAAVMASIRSKCMFFDIDDADKKEEGGKVIYYINFEIDNKDFDFLIDEKGTLLMFEQELKKSEIPAPILNTIMTQYGSFDLDDADLLEEGAKVLIKLKGEIDDKDHFFLFDGNNKMLWHTQDLRNSEIPLPVMNAIPSLYPGYEIRDADKIEEGGKTTYDIQLRKSKERINILFDEKGNVLAPAKE